MEQRTIKTLFALLGSVVCDKKLTDEERNIYSPSLLKSLLKISYEHDLIHLVALALKQNGLVLDGDNEIEKYIFSSVYRCERIKHEYQNICTTLEKAEIPFMPLKGAIIRSYYPEEWMRTSCDIDVLVREQDFEKAKSILIREHGYTYQGQGSHDISLYTPSKVNVELHHSLIEEGRANSSAEILKNVWDDATIKDGYKFFYEMQDDLFYLYHIAHMAKHFENGGCGIRTIIDLWLLDNKKVYDVEKRDSLLEKGELLIFANSVRKLSRIWFENQESDALSKQMEEFILRGGVYGQVENYILVQQQKKGGRFKYVLSKIFIPYEVIKFQYPILQKYKILTPIMQVRRWFKLIFCGHFTRVVRNIKYNGSISNEQAKKTQQFLDDIGL